MANTRVPDIALINLGFLLALKDAVVRDPVQAYYQFRLHPVWSKNSNHLKRHEFQVVIGERA
jgi:hypothetical protein